MKLSNSLARPAMAIATALLAAGGASASINVSINTAPYTWLSYSPTGTPIATTPSPTGGDQVSNDNSGAFDVGFWTGTYSFSLSSANQTFAITDLAADDRAVVELNGKVVAAAGIFASNPGTTGSFIFTPTGSQVSQVFTANGTQSISVTSGFNVGVNTIELIVNNTNAGINGGLTGGPTSLAFSGVISPNVTAIPEPATWAMMLVGLGGLGLAMRAHRKSALAIA